MNTLRFSLGTLAVALSILTPCPSWASPAPTSAADDAAVPARVAVEVDPSGLIKEQSPDAANMIAAWTRDDVEKALREVHGVEIVADPGAPTLIVRLGWVDFEKSIFRVEIAARRPGQGAVTVSTIERHFFPDTEVAKAAAENLSDALAELAKTPTDTDDAGAGEDGSEANGEEGPKAGDGGTTDRGDGVTTDDEPPSRLSTMGKAGIGLLATGIVGAGAGVGLLVVGEKLDMPTRQPFNTDGRNYKPAGVVLLSTGAAAAVAGAVLLVVDRRRAKSRHAAAAVRIVPVFNGIQVVGRF